MLVHLKNIYQHLPYSHLGILKYIPDKWLYGRSYALSKVSTAQEEVIPNLFRMLIYNRTNTDFGKRHIPLDFGEVESLDVMKSLPLVSFSDLASDMSHYASRLYNGRNSYITSTGGTGRNPTPILLSNESFALEWKHMHKIWKTCGYEKKQHLKLTLRGIKLTGEKLFEYNPLYNELVIDTFRLTQTSFQSLLPKILPYGIEYIHGYPSLVREFMDYLKVTGFSLKLHGIFLGSEGVSEDEKTAISSFFGCPVIAWYGQSEKVTLAYDTLMNGEYEVFTSYGFPYILNPDQNGFGEIIGTTFVNQALPLLNYRTGDYGSIIEKNEKIYLNGIIGRWGKDFLYLSPTKRIPTTSVNIHSKIQQEILFYQIHQSVYGEVHILILPKRSTRLGEEEITRAIAADLLPKLREFKVTYEVVHDESQIIKSIRGKMIMLVQEIKASTHNETTHPIL